MIVPSPPDGVSPGIITGAAGESEKSKLANIEQKEENIYERISLKVAIQPKINTTTCRLAVDKPCLYL